MRVLKADRKAAFLRAVERRKKKRSYARVLRGGQDVPMDIDKIQASFDATVKKE